MKLLTIAILMLAVNACPGLEEKASRINNNIDDQPVMKVAIFLYDGVEILDFSGPAEVFAVSSYRDKDGKYIKAFKVYTVAHTKETITSQGFLKVIPDYSIADAPIPDIIVLPGGATGKSRKTPEVINWIKAMSENTKIMMSVCTGAFLLGDAGLLDNKSATTWYGAVERLSEAFPKVKVLEHTRYVDNGNIVTTAGVSAGIDGALHIVGRLLSKETAKSTAEYMEYDKWVPKEGIVIAD